MYELLTAQIEALRDQYYALHPEHPGRDVLLDRIDTLLEERSQYSPAPFYDPRDDY